MHPRARTRRSDGFQNFDLKLYLPEFTANTARLFSIRRNVTSALRPAGLPPTVTTSAEAAGTNYGGALYSAESKRATNNEAMRFPLPECSLIFPRMES